MTLWRRPTLYALGSFLFGKPNLFLVNPLITTESSSVRLILVEVLNFLIFNAVMYEYGLTLLRWQVVRSALPPWGVEVYY